MTLRFTPRARDDLLEILTYVEKVSQASADRIRVAISDTVNLIASRPGIGIRNAKDSALKSFLVLRYPYRIHYLIDDADIWIVHIRHSARRAWGEDSTR